MNPQHLRPQEQHREHIASSKRDYYAVLELPNNHPDSKVHGANMGPTWVLSAPDGPHIGPMNLAIRANIQPTCIDESIKHLESSVRKSLRQHWELHQGFPGCQNNSRPTGIPTHPENIFPCLKVPYYNRIWITVTVQAQVQVHLCDMNSNNLKNLGWMQHNRKRCIMTEWHIPLTWRTQFLRQISRLGGNLNPQTLDSYRMFYHLRYRGQTFHTLWASYQIRKIAGCACAGNAGNVFPATDFKENRWLAIPTCITARASRTCRDACRDR